MTPHTFQRVRKLFGEAGALEASERAAWLDRACGPDAALRAEVESLLSRHDSVEGNAAFLQAPPLPPEFGGADPINPTGSGQIVANFRLIRVIGHGGMGVVYLAEQLHPKRPVALKLLRTLFATPSLLRRFEHEAEVLARLEHPGIARVYEAGTFDTSAGPQPYFAMELVNGVPLGAHARREKLSVRQRLELLARVCDAVQHAHEKGIVHRDIKPANILVDSLGQPKVLDFGVARAVDADVQSVTMQTQTGQVVGTLPYMSPEQAGGDVNAIDTRSDVYALGVVGYQLLANRLPYPVDGKPLAEAVRIIRDEEPSPLSSTDRGLRGDVETILAKALEKDKSRRYATAGELAADVRRFLHYEPIAARPAGTCYQLSRFARRHKAFVAAVVVVFLVLVGGITATAAQAVRATRAEAKIRREQEVTGAVNELFTTVLGQANPELAQGRELTVREALETAGKSLHQQFDDRPLIEAAIRDAIGTTFLRAGRSDLAIENLRRALELRRRHLGPDHADTLNAINALAGALTQDSQFDEAEQLFHEVLGKTSLTGTFDDGQLAVTRGNLGKLLVFTGRPAEAEILLRDALATLKRLHGQDATLVLSAMHDLATALQAQQKGAEAEELLRESLRRQLAVLGPNHPNTLTTMGDLASVLDDMDRHTESVAISRDLIERQAKVLGPTHPDTLAAQSNLAVTLEHAAQYEESARTLGQAWQVCRDARGAEHPDTLAIQYNLTKSLRALKRYDEALPLADGMYRAVQAGKVRDDRAGQFVAMYGVCLLRTQRFADAESPLLEAYERMVAQGVERTPPCREAVAALAIVYEKTDRQEQAVVWRARAAAATRPTNEQ